LKERPRGKGYVSDFVFPSKEFPVIVYGILINPGKDLGIAELELFRTSWGYFDPWGDFIDDTAPAQEDEADEADEAEPRQLITSDLLRRIPLGRIIALAQQRLAQEEWRTEGAMVLMGNDRGPDELTSEEASALESVVEAVRQTKRGRPPLPDDLLEAVAYAYLEEAIAGAGLLRRMSERFARPEATVRDWIAAARGRVKDENTHGKDHCGSPPRAGPGSSPLPSPGGAAPGPRLGW